MAGRPLGFLNAALCALAPGANAPYDCYEITSGTNSSTATPGLAVSVAGYPAGRGWDAVTGLGSPNATHLVSDLIALLLVSVPRHPPH